LAEQLSKSPPPRSRGFLVGFVIKVIVTATLITWLVRSGALEFGRVGILVSSWKVFFMTALTWMTMSVGLSSLRWVLILRMDGTRISLFRGAALQWMALFFNGLVPGNLGGDFIKNHAILGAQGGRIVVLVLIERVIGVISLIWVASLGVALHMDTIARDAAFRGLSLFLGFLMVSSVLGPILLLRWLPNPKDESPVPLGQSSYMGRLRATLREQLLMANRSLAVIRKARGGVALAFAASIAMHFGNMTYFLFLTRLLGNPEAALPDTAMVFPVGMLTLVLPVSISGLGVGHVMFNALFDIVGMVRGATIFNVYIIAQLAPSVFGAVPYLFLRSLRTPAEANSPTSIAPSAPPPQAGVES
jgi:hypothetical protein